MKYLILIFVSFIGVSSANAFFIFNRNTKSKLYEFQIIRVIDGDSIKVYIDDFPENLKKTTIRVANIDTPELGYKAQCEEEKSLAIEAKNYAEQLITNAKKIRFKPLGYEKYGRILAEVYLDKKSLAESLIEAKLAIFYDGGQRSNTWCHQ